ncbi:hypothetical protein DH2020_000422 [Rehmannia glutinosa]|uniref:Pollen Ole e 1 allergen and extensin family protein n=1 Tax=Rehmannia glutinosa TaxID=99300 RepID=A0ABR0XWW3_REHGL
MALKHLLVVLFVAIMTISVADAQTLGIVHVNGTLYCTANGSPGANGNATPVFPNASVQVVCSPDVVPTTPANATTNANGVYRVVLIPSAHATVDSIVSTCRLFVLTPLSIDPQPEPAINRPCVEPAVRRN